MPRPKKKDVTETTENVEPETNFVDEPEVPQEETPQEQPVTICGIPLLASVHQIALAVLVGLDDAITYKVNDGTNLGQTVRHRTIRALYQLRGDKDAAKKRFTELVRMRDDAGEPIKPADIDNAKLEQLVRENASVAKIGIKIGANTGAGGFARKAFNIACERMPSLLHVVKKNGKGGYHKGESDYPDHTASSGETTVDQIFGD